MRSSVRLSGKDRPPGPRPDRTYPSLRKNPSPVQSTERTKPSPSTCIIKAARTMPSLFVPPWSCNANRAAYTTCCSRRLGKAHTHTTQRHNQQRRQRRTIHSRQGHTVANVQAVWLPVPHRMGKVAATTAAMTTAIAIATITRRTLISARDQQHAILRVPS